jgi:hypothetical protein
VKNIELDPGETHLETIICMLILILKTLLEPLYVLVYEILDPYRIVGLTANT